MDSTTLSAIFVSLATLLAWLVAQARSTSQTQRQENRHLRAVNLVKDRYIYRLEETLAKHDLPFPDHPDGWDVLVDGKESDAA